MNNNILSPSSPSRNEVYTYNILEQLQITVEVERNPFGLPLDRLFQMAARINPKRSFLFVSRVLGKHLAVDPYVSLLSGAALSLLLYRELAKDKATAGQNTDHSKQVDQLEQAVVPSNGIVTQGEHEASTLSAAAWSHSAGTDERLPDSASYSAQVEAEVERLLPDVLKALMTGEGAKQAYKHLMAAGLPLTAPLSFIGFAETATALGHSMYAPFRGQASYVHTTRHDVAGLTPVITFEEEHSHAVAHRCYALDAEMIAGQQPIVLVDDEITTGKTTLNIIRALHEQYPRPTYYIASLLDWRSEQHVLRYAELEQELGITIVPLSLVKGRINVEGQAQLVHPPFGENEPDRNIPIVRTELSGLLKLLHGYPSIDGAGVLHTAPFVRWTGRFGLAAAQNAALERGITLAANKLKTLRQGDRTLCLGTEEFMYIPMRIAAELGDGVKYHSTTRSPVYRTVAPDYAIYSGDTFASPEDAGVTNYVYNIPFGAYDDVFVFLERHVPDGHLDGLTAALCARGFKQVNIVICGSGSSGEGHGDE
ncbi:phosphoribosyltransferase family protein [Paenibacillus campi]|uniref:phosphoribosyltransferase family protein n=1 Tax=Paenibacillus campi TaxID=3106031 RepID=UPI002AFEE3D1|nr:phosphoribosyltransferase family protein [Paenibacillus sp. SGZ-1009]